VAAVLDVLFKYAKRGDRGAPGIHGLLTLLTRLAMKPGEKRG
jgi:hypothetical protein